LVSMENPGTYHAGGVFSAAAPEETGRKSSSMSKDRIGLNLNEFGRMADQVHSSIT
jgi:hypothetical protein